MIIAVAHTTESESESESVTNVMLVQQILACLQKITRFMNSQCTKMNNDMTWGFETIPIDNYVRSKTLTSYFQNYL